MLFAVVAALSAAVHGAAAGGMGSMGTRHQHTTDMICATFDYTVDGIDHTIDIVRAGSELYFRGNARFWDSDNNDFTEVKLDLSDECRRGTVYKSVFVSNNPVGHPGMDFFGGGYGVRHWDAHFYTVSVADTEAGGVYDLSSCATTNIPILCDVTGVVGMSDPRNQKFMLDPPADYVPDDFQHDYMFGGHSVIGHGTHWIETSDFSPGGPMYYTVNGVEPDPNDPLGWLACAQQQPDNLGSQTDQGCRFGTWAGLSNSLITFDGKVVAHEPMVTSAVIARMAASVFGGSTARISRNFPQPRRFDSPGMSAQETFVEVISTAGVAEPTAHVGIVLGKGKAEGSKSRGLSASTTKFVGSDIFGATVAATAIGLVAGLALFGYRAKKARERAEYEPLEYATAPKGPQF